MPTVKFTGDLTKNFSLAEYTVHQTETCTITMDAIEHWQMLEEFRTWYGKPLTVSAGYRTSKYNTSVGGNKSSNHLKGCATDLTMSISKDQFLKLAKKWKSICSAHGTVGEAGYYANGWIHLGSHITYSKTFYNWYTDAKSVQHNMYFTI